MTRTTKTTPATTAKALLAALDRLPVAFALFDARRRLVAWNAPLAALGLVPKSILRQGTQLAEFQRRDAGLKRKAAGPHDVSLETGRVLQVVRKRVPPGQILVSYEDVTEARRARDEATEALERQTATAEILKVIASSPTDVRPVFDAIVTSARQLIGGHSATVTRLVDDMLHLAALTATTESADEALRKAFPVPLSGGMSAKAARTGVPAYTSDIDFDPDYSSESRERARARGYRSIVAVPMIRDEAVIGTIAVTRREPGPFTDHQIKLLKTFADQAVIAIENVRLFNETKESLERQTATAEILKVIASSPSDVQPVFDTIVKSALSLCKGMYANVFRYDGEMLHFMATESLSPRGLELLKAKYPMNPDASQVSGRVILAKAVVHIEDAFLDRNYDPRMVGVVGWRRMLGVPMLREGVPVGVIVVAWGEPGSILKHHEQLLQTFADQAVIAIENVRLFNETKEALERQTATAEILKVISSSPTDDQPVFDAIVKSAERLFAGRRVLVRIVEGENLILRALSSGQTADDYRDRFNSLHLDRDSIVGEAVLECRLVEVPDIRASNASAYRFLRLNADKLPYRSFTATPLVREGKGIGVIAVLSAEPGGMAEKEKELLQTFADQAVIAIENVRLFNETKESLERQTATAEILRVIASSPSDVQPVFDTVAKKSVDLCGGSFGVVTRFDGELIHVQAISGTASRDAVERIRGAFPAPPSRRGAASRCILTREVVHMPDVKEDPEYRPEGVADAGGIQSILAVPLLREGRALGSVSVARTQRAAFKPHQIELLKTFADQAVIAIENVRLFNETKEALERQTATAEVLRVISTSPSDVQPVFDTIAERAATLCAAKFAFVSSFDGELIHLRAFHGARGEAGETIRSGYPMKPGGGSAAARAVRTGATVQIPNVLSDPEYAHRSAAEQAGWRSSVSVPMIRDGRVIGALALARAEAGAFPEKQIKLLETFADQAVIAIENVRLFNETREALERQTATAEILKVIASSPSDVQPVFDAIAASARRLLDGHAALVARRAGDRLELAAYTSTGEAGDAVLRALFPAPITGQGHLGKAILSAAPVRVSDVETDDAYSEAFRAGARARGVRSVVSVPMLREGEPIGVISVNRSVPGKFSEHQTNLLKTFADQAVIAIENVRLFNETREALEQQTATAEILQVISSSPTDTQPVFDAIVQSGLRLFPGSAVLLGIPEGAKVRAAAIAHADPTVVETMRKHFPSPLLRDRMNAAAILDCELIDIPDAEAAVEGRFAASVKSFLTSGYRAITIAPMICGDAAIGSISVSRPRPGPLTEKQVALLRTFAAQAVIAIENVRVFKELEARTGALSRSVEQLTALGEVGRAISSTLDLDTVLRSIVSRAVQLTGMDGGTIYEYDEKSGEFNLRAAENLSEELVAMLRETPMRKGEGAIGHAVETGEPTEIADMRDESYQSPRRDFLIRAGYRALLVVPLRREDHIIGALAVNRKAPGHFSHEVVELLKTFATQSAMAIQNARLFREIAEKGRQLEEASQHKSQFLASMSHELRTPLNAILGFNEMLLGQVYGEVPADMQEPLKDIQTSGKHLLRLINNVLDLAKIEAGRMELSLQDYSVHDTVESVRSTLRPLAAEKGLEFLASVPNDLPLAYGDGGRITQCLMNLAGNSLKFTKAGKVEIAVAARGEWLVYKVSDTGIGIPPDKIASLFTEFKQTDATIASEYGGTGLGLSISRKFVEMHGGRIWVESVPGKGSAFMFEIPLRVKTP